MTRTDDDFAAVNLTVAGGNAWQSFSLTLDDVNGHEISSPTVHCVYCSFKIDRGKLEFNTAGAFADITLTVRVVVSESSPEVMKNYYPDRSLFTTVRILLTSRFIRTFVLDKSLQICYHMVTYEGRRTGTYVERTLGSNPARDSGSAARAPANVQQEGTEPKCWAL